MRVGRQRRAHAREAGLARCVVGGEAVGHFGRHAPDAGRAPAGHRHLPTHEEVGLQPVDAGVAAKAGGDRVRLVDQQQRAVRVASAARRPSWKPGSGSTMQQLVITGSVRIAATSPCASAASSAGRSLNSTAHRPRRQVVDLPDEARAVDRLPVLQRHHRVVDRAVVAAVEDEDLRPPRHRARDAQREAVGVGRGGGDLPDGRGRSVRSAARPTSSASSVGSM